MRFEIYQRRLLWRWRLVSDNNKVVCNPGEFFFSRANCKRNIALVKLAADAKIVEVAR